MVLAEVERHRPRGAAVIAREAAGDRGCELEYDTLIVAAGARHSYFGHDEWEPLAPGLKSLEDALELRRRILARFEAAEAEPDPSCSAPG